MSAANIGSKTKLTILGAGPGDPELISIKGLKALQVADVVLYDALIHPEIIALIPATTTKVFVGKQMGICQFPQDRINELIVEYALQNNHVVRLKGGDPFVFGRGHEELMYAQRFHIPCTIIPGISSSIAVPELHGIPLTRRGMNESFWVVTGSTKDHKLSQDITIAAQSSATVVVLMGMHKLEQIIAIFKENNKGSTPIGVFQNGSMPDEQYGLAIIDTAMQMVKDKNLSSPAIIVIGEVVSLHAEWK
jgi:uroporphyrin-III C-methyltransferase